MSFFDQLWANIFHFENLDIEGKWMMSSFRMLSVMIAYHFITKWYYRV